LISDVETEPVPESARPNGVLGKGPERRPAVQDDIDADFFHIPRPRGILRALLHLLRSRAERLRAQDRGDTITSVAAVLSDSGRGGIVTSRQLDDEWSVVLGPTAAATVSSRPPEQN
jgi:hypothetical protein